MSVLQASPALMTGNADREKMRQIRTYERRKRKREVTRDDEMPGEKMQKESRDHEISKEVEFVSLTFLKTRTVSFDPSR